MAPAADGEQHEHKNQHHHERDEAHPVSLVPRALTISIRAGGPQAVIKRARGQSRI
jgi:hypothetical protein